MEGGAPPVDMWEIQRLVADSVPARMRRVTGEERAVGEQGLDRLDHAVTTASRLIWTGSTRRMPARNSVRGCDMGLDCVRSMASHKCGGSLQRGEI